MAKAPVTCLTLDPGHPFGEITGMNARKNTFEQKATRETKRFFHRR